MKSDNEIRKRVIEEIEHNSQLTGVASQIGVTVKSNVVTLYGTVNNYSEKLAAEKAARTVKDVFVIAMNIDVSRAVFPDEFSDARIASEIRNALIFRGVFRCMDLQITVEKGVIYLDGTVQWDYEQRALARIIEVIPGVRAIVNKLMVINPKAEPAQIKKRISASFHRHVTADLANVNVSSREGKIILSGIVRSSEESKDALEVVRSMPGVKEVRNKLQIERDAPARER